MKPIFSILHICESIRGGIATYLDEIGTLQIADFGRQNVKFAVPRHDRKELPNIPDECIVQFEYPQRTASTLSSYIKQISRILREEKYVIVHAHSTFAGAVVRLLRAARTFEAPVVYCAHGWSFLMDVSSRRRYAYALIERMLAPFASTIISISQFEHDWALRIGLPPERCHLIRNGIGVAPQPKELRLPASRINLLFAGRLDRQKGADILLEAMHRLHRNDVHLFIAGEAVLGSTKVANSERVTALGWLTREELDSYYASVDALVMPSRWEGFGLSAIEAMRRSTAVIASDRGALPEIVVPGVTGLIVPSEKPEALASVLEDLDKERLLQWGKAGFERQQTLFSSLRVHNQLCEIYSTLVTGTANPAICSNVSRGPAIS